jgi:hypothetical protein
MKKTILSLALASAFALMPTAAHAGVPSCSADTPVGDTCVMDSASGAGDASGSGNIIDVLQQTVSSLTQNLWEENGVVADRDEELAKLKAYYHSKLEVLGGRIEGYKDEIRWQRHEIKRLRAQLHALQG